MRPISFGKILPLSTDKFSVGGHIVGENWPHGKLISKETKHSVARREYRKKRIERQVKGKKSAGMEHLKWKNGKRK